nr:hypothetical protein [Tanacetum cinerariifolium]
MFSCWEWSSIYRQMNTTVTAGGPGGPKYIWGLPSRLRSCFCLFVGKVASEDCRMVVKEIEDGLVEEMERIWNDGLSKKLMMKKRRMKKMKMVVKYENK